jgi:hypothetical protein
LPLLAWLAVIRAGIFGFRLSLNHAGTALWGKSVIAPAAVRGVNLKDVPSPVDDVSCVMKILSFLPRPKEEREWT